MSNQTPHTMPSFDEYLRQGEPSQQERASLWRTAIGLQAVDGLKPSDYLMATAQKHIEGEIDIDEARQLIHSYYQSKSQREVINDDECEADKASANITKILSSVSLDFSAKGFVALHRRIFEGVLKHAGELRQYDITKKEWVLDGDTVNYLNWEDLHRALDFDIMQERQFSYKNLSCEEQVMHLVQFVSGLWQIHPFGEGNTRTTAVFTILYLRHLGFHVNNDMFAQCAWYFRNALVRANYKSAVKGIDYAPEYLERFFRNLLLGEQWDLRNRYLHIAPTADWSTQPNLSSAETTDVSKNVTTADKSADKPADKVSLSKSNTIKLKIIRYAQSVNRDITQFEVSDMLRLSPRQTRYYLLELVKQGVFEACGANKNRTYKLR